MTKVLALQFFAAALVIATAGVAATVAMRVDLSPAALQAIAVAPVPQLIALGVHTARKRADPVQSPSS
jgi:hypothetical protein